VLQIDGPAIPALTISGFNLGDTIELTGIGYASGPAPTMGSNNVLSFTEGGSSYALAFASAQDFSGVVFQLVPNGAGTQIQISGLGGPVVTGGEVLTVSAGQHSSLLTVEDGGSAVVLSGGVMFSSLITDGGTLEVSSGGMASSLAISNEGLVRISAGGSATDVTVDRGGVYAALGAETSTTVDGGIFQMESGNSTDTLISGGGNEIVYGGADSDTTVDSGGQQDVYGGSAVDAIINSDGLQLASVPVIATTVNSGGHEIVNNRGITSNTVLHGGLLDLSPNGSATGAMTFGPGGGELRIYGGGVESAVISGFKPGDLIELLSIVPGSAPTAVIDPSNGMLIVSAGGTTYEMPFAADAASAHFQVATDGVSGSYVTELPCFAAGSRIATARGEVAVEDLRIGEAVLTQSGRLAPVRWLGHRRVECGRHPHPETRWPVRVRIGAFDRGVPHRDLLLSPDHAVFFDAVLIPVRYLINDASIVREAADTITYWHVELGRHDVILAEGLPCESFLDTGNRSAFENGGALVQMHPDFAQRLWDADACAPLVIAGPRLEQVREKLRERTPLAARGVTRGRRRGPPDQNTAGTQPSLRRNFLRA
jgi:autotransporter passenger strand-loop-strand repeat protein